MKTRAPDCYSALALGRSATGMGSWRSVARIRSRSSVKTSSSSSVATWS